VLFGMNRTMLESGVILGLSSAIFSCSSSQRSGGTVIGTPATCDHWYLSRTTTDGPRRVSLWLDFQQVPSGSNKMSTLDVGLSVQRRVLWVFWRDDHSYDSARISGQFAGPRSPRRLNGSYGYFYANPFDIPYSGNIRHFEDYSPASGDCFRMERWNYTGSAAWGGKEITSTISWP
jgi:hypothetical protein